MSKVMIFMRRWQVGGWRHHPVKKSIKAPPACSQCGVHLACVVAAGGKCTVHLACVVAAGGKCTVHLACVVAAGGKCTVHLACVAAAGGKCTVHLCPVTGAGGECGVHLERGILQRLRPAGGAAACPWPGKRVGDHRRRTARGWARGIKSISPERAPEVERKMRRG